MPTQCKIVLYPVKDTEKARSLFTTLLGTEPHVDSPYYVGFDADGAEIGLLPGGHTQGMTGPIAFFDVDDIAATLGAMKSAGAEVTQDPTDVGAGLLVAKVRDSEGNDIGLRQQPLGA
jgi:predicted enzyme related to lactoylglutathione lyase